MCIAVKKSDSKKIPGWVARISGARVAEDRLEISLACRGGKQQDLS